MSQFAPSSSVVPSAAVGQTPIETPRRGVAFWIGWGISGLVAFFFVFGGLVDVLNAEFARKGLVDAGYREEIMVPMGVVSLLSALLFLIPRTTMFGAILITAYLGGAVATHVIKAEYGMMIAPVIFAVVMWIGLVLRDRRIRAAVFG